MYGLGNSHNYGTKDGTWYTETITDVDDDTTSSVDNFLTEKYYENDNQQASEQKKDMKNGKRIKKYKKLSKAVEKFLRKYNWGKMEYLEEDNGIGIGFFNEEDKPQHIKEISKLYKLL